MRPRRAAGSLLAFVAAVLFVVGCGYWATHHGDRAPRSSGADPTIVITTPSVTAPRPAPVLTTWEVPR